MADSGFTGIKEISLKTNIGIIPIPTLDYINYLGSGGNVDLSAYLKIADAEQTYLTKPTVATPMSDESILTYSSSLDRTATLYTIAKNEYWITGSNSQIPTTAQVVNWVNSYFDSPAEVTDKITTALTPYLKTEDAEQTYAKISNVYTKTETNATFATKTALQTVAEIAQGRTKTYIVESWDAIGLFQLSEKFYTTSFSYINIFNSTTQAFTDTLGVDELKLGDIILVLAKDVPDLYVVGEKNYIAFAELESRTINVENYVTVNTQQNITGLKSFKIRPNIIISEELSSPIATLQDLEDKQVELPDNMAIIIDLTEAIITEAFVQVEEGEEQ